jgi:hypothetical protein
MPPLSIHLPFSKRRQSKSIDKTPNPARPKGLSRRLTIPLEQPRRVGLRRQKQQTLEQEDCILFRLPYEIRELIWRALLGGHCVAQDMNGVRIGDASDPWPPWETPGGHRRGLRSFSWEPQGGNRFISILMTCRRMFVFSVSITFRSVMLIRK